MLRRTTFTCAIDVSSSSLDIPEIGLPAYGLNLYFFPELLLDLFFHPLGAAVKNVAF
jgi:hypothetical protein